MANILVGAGGHAKVVYEVAQLNGFNFYGFIDPIVQIFFNLRKLEDFSDRDLYFLGIGGISPMQLEQRHLLYQHYKNKGISSLTLISSSAYVSPLAFVGMGSFVSNKAIIQPKVRIGENVIINTGAIIEHDVIIEDGVHVAPGAIVLGGCKIGCQSLIGAGAVILPGQVVPEKTLISSLTRYRNEC